MAFSTNSRSIISCLFLRTRLIFTLVLFFVFAVEILMDTPPLGEERGYVGLLHPRAERAGNDLPIKTTASVRT